MGGAEAAAPWGTCAGMCPAEEFCRRRRQGRLHRLELDAGREAEPALAVKEYSRPAAGKAPPQPEELRPPDVLLATVRHLLALAEEEGEAGGADPPVSPWERGAFVADRLRAVSLDVTVQRLALARPSATAALLERSLVCLLHAGHRLSAEPPARFDGHLHHAQAQETFAALRRIYRYDEAPRAQPCFQALFLLYNLGSPEALWQILQLPTVVRASPELSTALAIHWAFLERNFARFFRLARRLPYLQSCALHPHMARARHLALLAFSHGFSARNCRYPLARLAQLIATDSLEAAAALCQAQGLAVVEGEVVFQKGSFKDCPPAGHRRSCLLVDAKRGELTLLELAESICS
ncbi:SAC3 domain-containing protein 1 [Rhineura floridana]|uniref:SAC3 domain-containing protein 1 n=1 Tax=Rhineura floridana TaxID=261503 RepID=UPI002AC7F904|nr:SAC3 domain-containing protein 1 [Rhineura floridana]